MGRGFIVAGLLSLFTASASLAATQCPPTLHGAPLKKVDGAGMYEGNPADNALQAPSQSRTGPSGWVNTWQLAPGSASTMTIVCHYEGQREAVSFRLPASVRSCRQDASSFACQ